MFRVPFRMLSLALLVSIGILASAASAQAGVLVSSAPSCSSEPLSQPFLPWGDPASYTLSPGGSFENTMRGWTLTGGAAVTSGNETFYVGGSNDSKSLALPAGSSATSASVCVGIQNPTVRFFARNGGSATSTLQVNVLFEDSLGNVQSAPLATLTAGAAWQPTSQIPIVANLLPLMPDNTTAVAFTFTPQGSGGDWHIDDLYVDPWGRT